MYLYIQSYRSWNMRLILAPPESSFVLTKAEPLPSMVRSKSDCNCWIILRGKRTRELQTIFPINELCDLRSMNLLQHSLCLDAGIAGLKVLKLLDLLLQR